MGLEHQRKRVARLFKPGFGVLTIEAAHLDQFIHGAAALFVVGSQGRQFGVEELGSMTPVDGVVHTAR
jgi:hypothetical protein